MNPSSPQYVTAHDVLLLIEEAKNAEICRDLRTLRQILQTLWSDEDRSPSFDEFPPPIRAELLRIYGFFLTTYGLSQKKDNFQERGKDLLTNAIDLFLTIDLKDKAAEAHVILAFCYWNAGEVSECEDILKMVESEFRLDELHPVYLQIRINKLMVHYWNEEYDAGIDLIKQITPAMELCPVIRLKTMFHNNAGMIYRKKKLVESSAIHFNQAIRCANESNNQRFIAATFNNLSLLYCDNSEFESAHLCVDKAIKILQSIKDGWFLPHTIDSKASIYFAETDYDLALEVILQAIKMYRNSEDFRGLAEALWTQTKCLIRLNRAEEAFVVFSNLIQLSQERIGQPTVEKFCRELNDEIYFIKGLPLLDEVAEFKKSQVAKALIQTKGSVVKAAGLLQLKNHKTLSQILDKQFPELRDELGFERRAVRSDFKSKIKEEVKSVVETQLSKQSVYLNKDKIFVEREIVRIVLPEKNYSFDFRVESSSFELFFFRKKQMQKFGIGSSSIIAVFPVSIPRVGSRVIIAIGDDYLIGNIQYDQSANLFFILDETGFPVPVDEHNIIGEPVGYCPIEKAEGKFIAFSRLQTTGD